MKKFNFVFWSIIVVIILGSVFGIIKLASKQQAGDGKLSDFSVSADDNFKGDKNSSLPILIEYSDFQCPACAAYHPLLNKLNEELAGKMVFVYRHFPLPQHKNARPAAMAAEAAGKQGKFWEMHDIIFKNQSEWAESSKAEEIFAGYAEKLGLDVSKYKSDLALEEIKSTIDADYKSGIKAGVNATPSFFLNGRKINPRNYLEFKDSIESALNQSNQKQTNG